jgi:O-acetyl-ADP-ribose deacetylase (regulator of RNase III)
MNNVTLVLVDVNVAMVNAWRSVFDGEPCIEIVHGSLLSQRTSAWVSPTNTRAMMNGGLDGNIKTVLGAGIQARVRRAVISEFGDFLPVGTAVCVATQNHTPRFLVSTPTMVGTADDVSATMNVALAFGAALHAVAMQNRRVPNSISEIAVPGLGTGTGRVSPHVCADLMWTVWHLFQSHTFQSFEEMRAALEFELGDLSPVGSPQPVRCSPRGPVLPTPYHGRLSA